MQFQSISSDVISRFISPFIGVMKVTPMNVSHHDTPSFNHWNHFRIIKNTPIVIIMIYIILTAVQISIIRKRQIDTDFVIPQIIWTRTFQYVWKMIKFFVPECLFKPYYFFLRTRLIFLHIYLLASNPKLNLFWCKTRKKLVKNRLV